MVQIVFSVLKTVEIGGARCDMGGYTYNCAEEPAGMVPATGAALIVEPGAAPVVRMNCSLLCELSAGEAR